MIENIYKILEIVDDESHPTHSRFYVSSSFRAEAKRLYDLYVSSFNDVQFQQPDPQRCRYDDDIDDLCYHKLGLGTNDHNDFDEYLNQVCESIKDAQGKP